MNRMPAFFSICLCLAFLFIAVVAQAQGVSEAPGGTWVNQMQSPIEGTDIEITSGFYRQNGDLHGGIDIGVPEGTPVYAAASGTVVGVGDDDTDGFGTYVYIQHQDNVYQPLYTVYGHLTYGSYQVYTGQQVQQGQLIAYSGDTGSSEGPHLHFGVQQSLAYSHDAPLRPGLFVPQLREAYVGMTYDSSGSYSGAGGAFNPRIQFKWDTNFDFGKPLREIANDLATLITEALKRLKGLFENLLIMLIVIDCAYGSAIWVIDPRNGSVGKRSIFQYLVFKLLIYGCIIFFIQHWGSFVGNMARDMFLGAGAVAANTDMAEAAKAISDPFDLIQKGIHLLGPIFTQLTSFNGGIDLMLKVPSFFLMIPAAVGLMLCFGIIAFHVSLAYLEFYMAVLFSFSTFFFSGLRQTRSYAENGLNALLSSSVKLFFFTLFALILQLVMKQIIVGDLITVGNVAPNSIVYSTGGNWEGEEALESFAAAIRNHESGNRYDVYNMSYGGDGTSPAGGDGGYGAYQFTGSDKFYRWAKMYEDDHPDGPHLHRIDEYNDDFPNSPNHFGYVYSPWSYCPENQDMVAKYHMLNYYREKGNWHDVAMAWAYGGNHDPNDDFNNYWEEICNAGGGGSQGGVTVVMNVLVLIKLVLISIMFMLISTYMSKQIEATFGGGGFVFINNKND